MTTDLLAYFSNRFYIFQAETWVTPDIHREEMISHADSSKLPQFFVIVRGYRIIFRVKVSYNENGMPRYGLFASCSSLKAADTEDNELNLRASISGRCNLLTGYICSFVCPTNSHSQV